MKALWNVLQEASSSARAAENPIASGTTSPLHLKQAMGTGER